MDTDFGLYAGTAPDGDEEEPVGAPSVKEDEDEDEEDVSPSDLSFCELCGTGEDDDDELLRCEECGRLHCSACREYDDEGTPYCTDCYDEVVEA